jgi:transcriptional regulator with XRE-family HTH domain
MSRAATARASGIEAADIERIETEELNPTLGQLRRLASALEIPVEELLSLPPSPLACEIHLTSGGEAASKAAGKVAPVPVVSGQIAAGNARIVDEAILGWLFLPREEFGHSSSNLIAVQIYGRSMEPDLPDGCVAVIDRNDRVITSDGIFALRDQDGGCTVKRVEVLDEEHVALIPSNRSEFKVEFWKLSAGESLGDRTIGRVV